MVLLTRGDLNTADNYFLLGLIPIKLSALAGITFSLLMISFMDNFSCEISPCVFSDHDSVYLLLHLANVTRQGREFGV